MATIANDRPPPDHPERPEHDAIEWAGVEMILTRIESLCWSTLLSSKVTELKRRLEPNCLLQNVSLAAGRLSTKPTSGGAGKRELVVAAPARLSMLPPIVRAQPQFLPNLLAWPSPPPLNSRRSRFPTLYPGPSDQTIVRNPDIRVCSRSIVRTLCPPNRVPQTVLGTMASRFTIDTTTGIILSDSTAKAPPETLDLSPTAILPSASLPPTALNHLATMRIPAALKLNMVTLSTISLVVRSFAAIPPLDLFSRALLLSDDSPRGGSSLSVTCATASLLNNLVPETEREGTLDCKETIEIEMVLAFFSWSALSPILVTSYSTLLVYQGT
ncbi:hypothetical protein JCM16303_003777 [Sporobolomyces ruberrimus]